MNFTALPDPTTGYARPPAASRPGPGAELSSQTPREIRRRPGRGWLIGGQQLIILPHTLAGIGINLFVLFTVALLLFGTVVPGRIARRSSYMSKNRRIYQVRVAYEAAGLPRTETESVPVELYNRLPEGTPVQVKALALGSISGGAMLVPGHSPWGRLLPLVPFGLFWNLIVGLFLWKLYCIPFLYRHLVRSGVAVLGVITDKQMHRGKTTTYFLRYEFIGPDGETVKSKMDVHRSAWEGLRSGQPATVLYMPGHPRLNVLYQGTDYEVI